MRHPFPTLTTTRTPPRRFSRARFPTPGLAALLTLALLPACGEDDSGGSHSAGTGQDAGDPPSAGGGGTSGTGGGKAAGGRGQGAAGKTGGGGKASAAGAPNGPSAGGGPSFADGPVAGNPDGQCAVPAGAGAEDTSSPDHVIGTGTAESCTGAAFVSAVALGGVITFDCGADPVTIVLPETAKVFNDQAPKIVIDGGGKVALSGGGTHRILYMNTCDEQQVWTSSHCDNQETPQLTVQNLTFVAGNAKGVSPTPRLSGGGAIFSSGGRLKIVNSRFFNNTCDDVGPDVGGAAVRAFQQFDGLPIYVVGSTFGGQDGLGNVCSNGGGLSSIGVSFTVVNSLFSYNDAIGNGANPATAGTPGGGSGGAIYNDGNTFTLSLCGTKIEHNTANEGGGAIFFVSNDRSGSLVIRDSTLSDNPSAGFETRGYPGIFVLASGDPQVTNSTLTP